jgi:hypothetical protein
MKNAGCRWNAITNNAHLRAARVIKGLTDAELGAILGVTTEAARKMRTGRTKSLKLEAALPLARAEDFAVVPCWRAGTRHALDARASE